MYREEVFSELMSAVARLQLANGFSSGIDAAPFVVFNAAAQRPHSRSGCSERGPWGDIPGFLIARLLCPLLRFQDQISFMGSFPAGYHPLAQEPPGRQTLDKDATVVRSPSQRREFLDSPQQRKKPRQKAPNEQHKVANVQISRRNHTRTAHPIPRLR
jgi:hypothetical protein